MSLTTLTSKGQVTIPKNIRDLLHLYAGDKVEFVFNETNDVVLRPVTKKVNDVFGKLSKYKQKTPVSIEEMNESIKTRIREQQDESS